MSESLDAVLERLRERAERLAAGKAPEVDWQRWKRKTFETIAKDLREQGDRRHAKAFEKAAQRAERDS